MKNSPNYWHCAFAGAVISLLMQTTCAIKEIRDKMPEPVAVEMDPELKEQADGD